MCNHKFFFDSTADKSIIWPRIDKSTGWQRQSIDRPGLTLARMFCLIERWNTTECLTICCLLCSKNRNTKTKCKKKSLSGSKIGSKICILATEKKSFSNPKFAFWQQKRSPSQGPKFAFWQQFYLVLPWYWGALYKSTGNRDLPEGVLQLLNPVRGGGKTVHVVVKYLSGRLQ